MEDFLNILYDLFPEVDFETEDRLVDEGILDAYDIESIVSEVEDQLGLVIPAEYQNATYFNSAEDMYDLIQRLDV